MLCVPVCLAAVKIVAKATPAVPLSVVKARWSKDWIDATISESTRSFSTEGVGVLWFNR
jgi:hypothetical protein